MEFLFRPMNEETNKAILAWHYEGQYAVYDIAAEEGEYLRFTARKNWPDFFTVHRLGGELIGYFLYSDDDGVLTVDLGLEPDLMGKGLGVEFVKAGLAFARGHYCPKMFRLEVLEFNLRARKVYERVGFRYVREYVDRINGREYPCLEMVME